MERPQPYIYVVDTIDTHAHKNTTQAPVWLLFSPSWAFYAQVENTAWINSEESKN